MIRDLKFDNLRGLAIILVVLGHFVARNPFSDFITYEFTYRFIFLFHMPLLVFVSGYLSKISPDSTVKAFKGVFIPYLIFNTFWIIFIFLMEGTIPNAMYLIPEWGLWYLLSLFFWRTLLPAADKVKYVFWISILLALFIGTVDFRLSFLSISRTICFFPVFLLGFYFKDIKEKLVINRYLAAGIFIILLIAITLFIMPQTAKILYLKDSYLIMGMGNKKGIILRFMVIFVGMISTVLLFNIMTSKKTFLTKIGRNSLPVYVLHFYFILSLPYILNYLGLNFIFHSYLLTTIYVILTTAMVTFILSQDKVNESVNTLIKKVTKTLIKDESMEKPLFIPSLSKIYLKLNQQNITKFLIKVLNSNRFYRRIKEN